MQVGMSAQREDVTCLREGPVARVIIIALVRGVGIKCKVEKWAF